VSGGKSIDFNAARKIRDRRLRRALLVGLYETRGVGRGVLVGRSLVDTVNLTRHGDQRFVDDEHALALLRDMINKGYVAEHALTRRKGEERGLDNVEYAIAATGTALIEESIDPDPDVDDLREVD
jgi:hypothetical protein